jgi:hypothetical protein
MKQISPKLKFGCSLALIAICAAGTAVAAAVNPPTASVVLDSSHKTGGVIPQRFMGIAIEWSLIERYMNPNAQPAFVNLLNNLNSGFIRVGGGSQDNVPYSADAPNTDAVITNADFGLLRSTLDILNSKPHFDAAPPWGTVLGAWMKPTGTTPAGMKAFVQGIATMFAGAENSVAGISLGNEPDQDGYGTTFSANNYKWLTDFATYSDPAVSGPWPLVVPNTSTDIVSWQTLADQAHPSRWFWNWPQILDAVAPAVKARAGVFGPWVSDHFYAFARNGTKPEQWRYATIPLLLGKDHMDALDYLVYNHAGLAAQRGLPYRLDETNTSARQGTTGVSDVAASATYALDMMFHLACPQPPDQPGANAECTVGGVGMNLQNACRNGNANPSQGNAYYNVIYFDPSDAMGPPVPAPEYYGALFFAKFAQGTSGLRPVAASGQDAGRVSAWRVEAGAGERRLFVINKSVSPLTTSVSSAASRVLVHTMQSFDPTGTGKTVDASANQIDGRQVAADGTWPGFAATSLDLSAGSTVLSLAPGAAAVLVEYPTLALQMVPTLVNLRTTAGTTTIVLTATAGDLSLWDLSNFRLFGVAPLSIAKTSDGRSIVATFSKVALKTLPAGDVSVLVTGDIARDGLVTQFSATTTVHVIR